MEPVSLLPMKARIAELLRAEIFSGRLEDGLELAQEAVAGQLRVSRIPVREAFQQLEAEGLLERLPNRHVRVVGLTAARLEQNFRVLAATEAELAAMRLSSGLLTGVADAFSRCRRAYETRDRSALLEADREFHLSLGAAPDNPTLRQLHKTQYRVLYQGCTALFSPEEETVFTLDREIHSALEAGDVTGLCQAVRTYYAVLAEDAVKEMTR